METKLPLFNFALAPCAVAIRGMLCWLARLNSRYLVLQTFFVCEVCHAKTSRRRRCQGRHDGRNGVGGLDDGCWKRSECGRSPIKPGPPSMNFEMKVKATWSDDLKIAYNQLVSESGDVKQARQKAKLAKKPEAPKIDSQLMAAVKRVKEADDDAYNAHEDAEDVFAEAEKRMSTSGAREGARKALHSLRFA